MGFWLYLKQNGQGCDYTIGCGTKLVSLRAATRAQAEEEASELLDDYSGTSLGAVLIEGQATDLDFLLREKEESRKKAIEQRDRAEKLAQLEKLKRELGES